MPGKLGSASARDSPPSLRREATSSCVHSAMASKEETSLAQSISVLSSVLRASSARAELALRSLAPEIIVRTESPMALPQCNRRKKVVVSQTFGLCLGCSCRV